MNLHVKRTLAVAGAGALALITAGALAAPAMATGTSDLELKLVGGTLAVDTDSKVGSFSVTNHGPEAAAYVSTIVDPTGLDLSKVEFVWDDHGGCEADEAGVFDCAIENIAAGESWEYSFTIKRKEGATGAAGDLKLTIGSEQDANLENNTKTLPVVLSEANGVDLRAEAWDVVGLDADGKPDWDVALKPGDVTKFIGYVRNQGDRVASGTKMEIKLPEHLTFIDPEPGICDFEIGDTTGTCEYTGTEGDLIAPGAVNGYSFKVKVAADAVGPIVATGGVFTVSASGEVKPTPMTADAPADLPNVWTLTEQECKDIDPSDNSDDFVAYIASATDGGTGGGLPVTGVQVGMIAGVGGAAVAGGALLLAMARRRENA